MTTSYEIALLAAVKFNQKATCETILKRATRSGSNTNVVSAHDMTFEGGKTPILIAACEGHTDILDLLIRYKANVNDQCPIGMTVCFVRTGFASSNR